MEIALCLWHNTFWLVPLAGGYNSSEGARICGGEERWLGTRGAVESPTMR